MHRPQTAHARSGSRCYRAFHFSRKRGGRRLMVHHTWKMPLKVLRTELVKATTYKSRAVTKTPTVKPLHGEGWIVLKQTMPIRYDTVLCSEQDVRNLILSCVRKCTAADAASVIFLAVHVGKNLKSRFAHVKVQSTKCANVIVRNHSNSLGREHGRWGAVQASVRAAGVVDVGDSCFGFYCARSSTD